MKKRKKQMLSAWAIALTMLLNMFVPLNTAFAEGSKDVSLLLKPTVSVTQGGKTIGDKDTGDTINSTEPIVVKISFGVSVEGDGTSEADAVHYGDTAAFKVSDQFKLLSGSSIDLKTKDGNHTVGHASFQETAGKVTAEVTFDGDQDIFDAQSGYEGVTCEFGAKLQYDGTDGSDAGEEKTVTILNKTYTLRIPPKEKVYTVTKRGVADLAAKQIAWTVDITATQGSTKLPLEDYIFSDDLANVGAYVEDSFKVDGSAPAPSATYGDNKLTYTFPTGSTSPKQIIFKTAIPDEKYYAQGEQTVSNTAKLLDGTTELGKGTGEVKFTPTWIEKKGTSKTEGSSGVYDPKDRTITWTITANQMGASLKNAVITDDLTGSGLTFKSATAKKWDTSTNEWVDFFPAKEWDDSSKLKDGKDYELGDINSQVVLEIVTTVPDEDYTTGEKNYANSASIRWDSGPSGGIGSGGVTATIGYNAITKSGSLDGKYQNNPQVKWTVNVDFKGQSVPKPKVYDLLVYGNSASGFDLNKATGFPEDLTVTDLTPEYGQKYIDNTFKQTDTNGTNLKITVIHIWQDKVVVADLLEITGLSTTNENTFTFDSEVVDPDIFAGNTTKPIYNTATLFSANSKLNKATAYVYYPSHMLKKEMLKSGSAPATQANNKTTNAAEGFDYVDKSVIFRLSVNADGLNLTEMKNAKGEELGTATLTDTLPDGWVFDKISGNEDYLIFKGDIGNDSSVTATGDPLVGADNPVTKATISGDTAAFAFNTLNKPYVILVKARPTDATLTGYFAGNTNTTIQTVINKATLNATNWTNGINTTQEVSIKNTLLEKTYTVPSGSKGGELLWTLDYKPYDLTQTGTKLEDTLPVGIDLRTDANGNLILDGNITITPLTLNADGSYKPGTALSAEDLGKYISYNSASRVLIFTIPDSAKAYRFTYLTDVTGDPGTSISNKVSLIDGKISEVNTAKNYAITEADGSATLKRNGSVIITKTDGDNDAKLSGAKFTLYAADGATVLREGITADSTGKLTLRAIPDGTYILKETVAPAGYTLDAATHKVTVKTEGTKVTTSIDGTGSNTITIKNHKEGTIGNLTISKTVAGNAADKTKVFTFTLTLTGAPDTYFYIGSGVPDGTIGSGGTISLTHGQSITITGLPKDATYEVKETDSGSGYTTTSTGATGAIEADKTQAASFTNTKNVSYPASDTGNLTISKTVAGTGADTAKKFDFTVTFSGATGSYHYTGNGVPDGTIKSGDTISLAHGQSITVTGLPAGATYQVSEEKASAQGYSVETAGSAGTISSSQDRTAAVTNTKLPISTGSLTISKTVTGQGADLNKKFDFTVTLTDAPDAYPYTGASTGTLRSGDTISLANGQSITITGLPAGAKYVVTEADYTGEGYTDHNVGAAGIISSDALQTASFTNEWSSTPGKPGTPKDPPDNIEDEEVPQGSMDGGKTDVPGGGGNILPKTGDNQAGDYAKLGILFFSAAFAIFATADYILRKKKSRREK